MRLRAFARYARSGFSQHHTRALFCCVAAGLPNMRKGHGDLLVRGIIFIDRSWGQDLYRLFYRFRVLRPGRGSQIGRIAARSRWPVFGGGTNVPCKPGCAPCQGQLRQLHGSLLRRLVALLKGRAMTYPAPRLDFSLLMLTVPVQIKMACRSHLQSG